MRARGIVAVGPDRLLIPVGNAELSRSPTQNMAQVRAAEVRSDQGGFGELRMAEIGPAKVGIDESGIDEAGPAQVRFGEVSPDEVDAVEVGPAEVGAAEVYPAEVGPFEGDAAEVRSNSRIVLTPPIPRRDALSEPRDLLAIRHDRSPFIEFR